MRKMFDYEVVAVPTNNSSSVVLQHLVKDVLQACADGWKPHGSLVSWGGMLIQPMVRTTEGDF